MASQHLSSGKSLVTSSGQPAITSAPRNLSATPVNQIATGNGEQAPKKRRKRNKKRKNNNVNVGGSGPQTGSGNQPTMSQTSQKAPNASRAAGGQQPKQAPAQANRPPQAQSTNAAAQNPNKRPNLGFAPTLPPKMKPPAPPTTSVFAKFNDFPPEIQKRIFEVAYRLTEYGQPDKWVYISRKVREWIEPFIYESVVLPEDFQGGHRRLGLYERTFKSKPKEFYTRSVKKFYTNNPLNYESSDFELELLPICDNLVSLECWSDARDELTTILKTKTWPDLKTLCLNIDLLPLDENTFHLPIFKNVTHLDFTSKDPQLPSWASLKSLDNLTYMCVYMLIETPMEQYLLAMDQAYAVATEAQKCFPPNLKYFVMLVPIDLLYPIVTKEHKKPKDKQRWDKMEDLRLGTFDPRVILGSHGDWDNWLDGGDLSDVDEDSIDELTTYAEFLVHVVRQKCPQDHLLEDERDTWEEIVTKDLKRRRFLASQKK